MKAKSGKFAVSLILLLTIVLALYSGIAALTSPPVLAQGPAVCYANCGTGSKTKGTKSGGETSASTSTTVVSGSNTCPPSYALGGVVCVTQSTTTVSGTTPCPPATTANVCVPQTCQPGYSMLGGQCMPTTSSPCPPNSIGASYSNVSPNCTPCPTYTVGTTFENYPPACRPSKPCLPGSVSTPDSPATKCTPCPQGTHPISVDLYATAGCGGNVPPCTPGSTVIASVTTKNADGATVVVRVTATCPAPNGPNSPCGTTDLPTLSANGVINCVPCPSGQTPGTTAEMVQACVPRDRCPSGSYAVGADGCVPCPQGTAPASMDAYGDGGCEPNTSPDPCAYGAPLTIMTTTTDSAGLTHIVQTVSTCSNTTVVTGSNSCPPTVAFVLCVTATTTFVSGNNTCSPTAAGVICATSNPSLVLAGLPPWAYLLPTVGLLAATIIILLAGFRRRRRRQVRKQPVWASVGLVMSGAFSAIAIILGTLYWAEWALGNCLTHANGTFCSPAGIQLWLALVASLLALLASLGWGASTPSSGGGQQGSGGDGKKGGANKEN
jgi:hypothetical protein